MDRVDAPRPAALQLRRLTSVLSRVVSVGALLLLPRLAAAENCSGPLSPCFDANSLDLAIGPSQFASLEDAVQRLAPGQLSVAVALGYLHRPVVLTAPSPDPDGRSLALVEHLWQTDVLLAAGIFDSVQLGIGLPFRPYQDGAGIDGTQSREGGALPSSTVGDPRVGLSWRVFAEHLAESDGTLAGQARLEVKLPLGDETAFAGAPQLTWMPSFSLSASDLGPWRLAAEVGARLRPTTRIGDVNIGHQLRVAVGVRYALIEQLSLGVEAWMLPSLVQQPSTPWGRARYLPAEWLASLGAPITDQLWIQAGAGTGLPLSRQGTPLGDEREALLGVTTPDWRALVQVRFTE